MSHKSALIACAAVLAGTISFAACSSDAVEPAPDATALVAGDYRADAELGAFRLTTISDGEEIDWLERGAEVTLTLRADGTTSGRLFVPGGDEDGGDLDADLAGTFTVTQNIVEFHQDADTFIRDMPFAWQNGRLSGDRTFGDVRVVMELVRE